MAHGRLGRYRLLEALGSGANAEVYRGWDARLRRDVVVKVLDGTRGGAALHRALGEARSLARLRHPAVAAVYDAGINDGRAYLVTEFLGGVTLQERLRRGRLATAEVVRLGLQLLAGLAAVHAAGVVHGDIKPANLLLTPEGLLKILDFGVAALGLKTVQGTPAYMAPELLERPGDARSDLFSSGVVLYEMATGRRPFDADDVSGVVQALARGSVAPLRHHVPTLPEALEATILRALAPDPDRRYPSAGSMARTLRALHLPPEGLPAAKVVPPDVNALLPRPRIHRLLGDAGRGRIVWVQGPPGGGKTVALASFARTRKAPTVWYRIDPSDRDVAGLLGRLAATVTALRPEGPDLPPVGPEIASAIEGVVPTFCGALFERLGPGGALVLEDAHRLDDDGGFHAFLGAASESIPPDGAVLVTSRTPPAPGLASLAASGRLALLPPDVLDFRPEETRALAERHRPGRSAADADQVHARTQGWPAGTSLLLAVGATEGGPFSARASGALDALMRREVLPALDPAWVARLLEVCFLPILTDRTLAALGSRGVRDVLTELSERGLFVTAHGRGDTVGWMLHPLLADFLRTEARRRLPESEIRRLEHRALEALIASNHLEEAVAVAKDLEAWEALAPLVKGTAPRLLAEGRHATLGDWLSGLPAEVETAHPVLTLWRALARLPVDGREAGALALEALRRLRSAGDGAGAYLAWAAAVECEFLGFEDASGLEPMLKTYADLRRDHPAFASAEVESMALAGLCHVLLYRWADASRMEPHRERLEVLLPELPPGTFAQAAWPIMIHRLWRGLPAEARALCESALVATREAPGLSPLWETGLATALFLEGRFEEARSAADRAIAGARQLGSSAELAVMMRARTLLAQGELEAAEHAVRDAALRAGLPANAGVEEMLGRLALAGGEPRRAAAHLRAAVDRFDRAGIPYAAALARVALAWASLESGRAEDAVALTRATDVVARRSGSHNLRSDAALVRAEAAWRLGRPGRARRELCIAFGEARRAGLYHHPSWPRAVAQRQCALALTWGIELDWVRAVVRRLGIAAPADVPVPSLWPWPWSVQSFGGLALWSEGRPVVLHEAEGLQPARILVALILRSGVASPTAALAQLAGVEGPRGAASFAVLAQALGEALRVERGQAMLDRGRVRLDLWEVEDALDAIAEDPGACSALDAVKRVARRIQGPLLPMETTRGPAAGAAERLTLHLQERLRLAAGHLSRQGLRAEAHGLLHAAAILARPRRREGTLRGATAVRFHRSG